MASHSTSPKTHPMAPRTKPYILHHGDLGLLVKLCHLVGYIDPCVYVSSLPCSRLKRSQELMSEPLPGPETSDMTDTTADSEAEPTALPMCGSICPSSGSS